MIVHEHLEEYEPSVTGTLRRALTQTIIGGVPIPTGTPIFVFMRAATRDLAQVPEPDCFASGCVRLCSEK